MFNPACLIVDAVLSISLAWNSWLTENGFGFLVIPDDGINQMFDLFIFLCGLGEEA